jgi:AraC-like DNA-binding protein
MTNDSIVTNVDLLTSGGRSSDHKPGCTFWTGGRDGQMCVQHFRPEEEVFYQPHTHSEYTIVVCLEGEILKTQLGQTHVIGRGGVMIGNHGVEHSSGYLTRDGKSCQAVSLSLDRRLLASLTSEFDLPPADGGTCPAFTGRLENVILRDCAQAIAEELGAAKPGHKIVIETLATRLVVEAMRAWPRANIEKIDTDLSPRLPRKDFVRAYEFMRWCRKDNFRVQNLCHFLGSSEERFTRLFLASTRHTPASFYNRMLLERSRDLLRDPRLSIKEIGFQLGFKTSSHFIASFRREFAASPQEHRQRAARTRAA